MLFLPITADCYKRGHSPHSPPPSPFRGGEEAAWQEEEGEEKGVTRVELYIVAPECLTDQL